MSLKIQPPVGSREKQRGTLRALDNAKTKVRLVLTIEQKRMFPEARKWLKGRRHRKRHKVFYVLAEHLPKDKRFVEGMAVSLRLNSYRLENW